jgi:hypothetical protein
MVTSGLDWKASVRFLAGGCAVLFGVCAVVELAQAQYVVRPNPPQAPVLNPSTPYTVPQPSYRPITPAPSAATPGYVSAPVGEPRTAGYPHRRAAPPKPLGAESHGAKKRRVHRSRAVAVGPAPAVAYSSYYAPFGYGYGCAWRRAWDGHWFRTSPCS